MKPFSLNNIVSVADHDFSKGIFILLFDARTIPPHLLLSIDGKIYSLTDAGRQMGSSLEKLLLFVKRKKVPTLFVEWSDTKGMGSEKLENLVRNCFLKYDRVKDGKVSCLFPIRDAVSAILGEEMETANFVFELLPLMEKQKALGKVFEMNMRNEIENGEFELLRYTEEELKEALRLIR